MYTFAKTHQAVPLKIIYILCKLYLTILKYCLKFQTIVMKIKFEKKSKAAFPNPF